MKKMMTILLGDVPADLPQWNPPYSDQQADNILRNLFPSSTNNKIYGKA
ncbi:hypothetical protein INT80_02770 [Gallibacterium anatis]|uniref:Uncharacterized protein n=1 Tax=Gallibacterium anatis TaxID=750 RepID=A0A930YA62_9PAST|nr:hypothetical protein [Gallibacterium anatis]